MARGLPTYRSLMLRLGLDPRAVEAVARGEGGLTPRPGTQDIGDRNLGFSVGPFQLFSGGALPARIRSRGMEYADQWAWSPEGIRYALGRIASVAKGQKGERAVRSIITQFEKPAKPGKSIADALARLESSDGPVAPGTVPARMPSLAGPGQAPGPSPRQTLIQGLLTDKSIFDIVPAMAAARGRSAPVSAAAPLTAGVRPPLGKGGVSGVASTSGPWGGSKPLADSLIRPLGLHVSSEKRERKSTKSGGVSDHWVGSKNAYAYDLGGSVAQMDAAAVKLARQLGLKGYKKGQPLEWTGIRGNHRVQVLYRTNTGGNHFDHIHLGVRRR
jgi:hypothetical protein